MWADSLPAELPGKPWVFCASNWDPLCVSSPFTARPHQIHTHPAPVLCARLFSKAVGAIFAASGSSGFLFEKRLDELGPPRQNTIDHQVA